MTRIPRWLLAAMVTLVLGGCVSDRGAEPEPTRVATPLAGGIPTLPALAQLPPTPTPQPTLTPVPTPTPVAGQTAPSRVDSSLALPREPLEDLGLVPQETGVDIFYQLALTHYEGRALFDNYWAHPEEATARIAYVSDFRYAFPSRTQTDAFLFNASYGLVQAAAGDGNDVTEYYAYLGDTSFVAGFTKPGQAVYAAQFATGTTAAVVIIAGNDTVSVDEALGIFRLAADALGARYSDDGTPVPGSTIPGMVTGEWMARQRDVLIGADGTGHVRLNSGCCNGVVYYVTIEDHASPTRATVVGRSFIGDIGHTDAAPVSDVIWLEIRADGAYEVLVITLPESEKNFIRELTLCRDPLDPPCEW